MRLFHVRSSILLASSVLLGSTWLSSGIAQESPPIVTVTQWDGMGIQTLAFDEAIAIFEERNPHIKIERRASPTAIDDSLLALEFKSPEPDIVPVVTETLQLEAPLFALNEFPDFEAFRNTIPNLEGVPLFVDGINLLNGDVVSLPFERQLPLWHLFVNTALYREAGLVDENGELLLPKTLAEFFQNSLTIHQQTGAYGFSSDSELFENFLQLCTYSLRDLDAVLFGYKPYLGRANWAGEPCYQELFSGFQMLWDAGAIPPDHLQQSYRVMRERFVKGEVAHIIDGIWATSNYLAIDPTFKDYILVPKPLASGLDHPISYEGRTSIVNPQFLGINAHSAHPNEAWEWLKFIHSAEFAEIWLKYEFGVSIYLTTDPASLPLSPIFQTYLAQSDLLRMTSPLEFPPIQVYPELFGPTYLEITQGILNGTITDFQAAMMDYDRRVDDAVNLAFAENQALGIDISPQTFTDQNYRWLDAVPLLPSNP